MISIVYELCLILSCLIIIYMATRNYDKIDIYYCTMMVMIPVIILGYWLQTRATTVEGSMVANCFLYLDGTVLLMVTFFSMLRSFGIAIKNWMKIMGYGVAFGHCLLVWQCFGTNLYYSTVELVQVGSATATIKTSGPLRTIHNVFIAVMILLLIITTIAGMFRKGNYSRKTLYNYAIICLIGLVLYVIEEAVSANFTSLPFLYIIVEILIVIDYDHIHMHDISGLISDQQKTYSAKGYVAIDFRKRFLSCNDRAKDFFDFLKEQREDENLPVAETLFDEMIEEYELNGTKSKKFKVNDITCVCEINEFSVRKDGLKQGYLFEIRDATEEQKVLDVMEAYTTTLNAEVKEKTESISEIQQKIVIGMANIIENRDNNTGGHVKRTSDVVTILIDEILKQGKFNLDYEFTSDIVRAAPMHDLGKVSIDSTILCKPGRLDENEYAIMKSHSEKSCEMVNILLKGVEEEHFVNVAYNVARYHHERWDGKGYPEGLVGSMIPIEARIMAIADVYDALVSKRCYKEPMSFEKAKEIMCEGMGTQFDPNLKEIFLLSLSRLETYYKNS